MLQRRNPRSALLTSRPSPGETGPVAADPALQKALEALKGYDWGQDPALLRSIDDALLRPGDAAARAALEARLAAVLGSDAPLDAKQYVCRWLCRIGTAACVPALAALLPDTSLSHLGRYALEQMTCPEAAAALRDALPSVSEALRVGIVNSLGARRDAESTSRLAALLLDPAPQVAAAAANALGWIGTPEAARALASCPETAPAEVRRTVADARLACAEKLLATGERDGARDIYRSLASAAQPAHVRLAAETGLRNVGP